MEMHQVRYFLAAVAELNFTKAAEKCNVSQPSLTRAIKQLEGELGGDLFRRERPQAQLTELGQRMLPLLKQCYESALHARSLATAIKKGEVGALKLAISGTIDLDVLTSRLAELARVFPGLEIKLLRGTATDVVEFLKSGDAELAIAAGIDEEWDRLDRWPLFTEHFRLLVNGKHGLAGRPSINLNELKEQRFIRRTHCECGEQVISLLRDRNLDADHGHDVASERDLISLIEADLGIAIVPHSLPIPSTLSAAPIEDVELCRTVSLYGVAGRQRTNVAATMLKILRAADWSRYAN